MRKSIANSKRVLCRAAITMLMGLSALAGAQALAPGEAAAMAGSGSCSFLPQQSMWVTASGQVCLIKVDVGGGVFHYVAPETIRPSGGQPGLFPCSGGGCLPDSRGGGRHQIASEEAGPGGPGGRGTVQKPSGGKPVVKKKKKRDRIKPKPADETPKARELLRICRVAKAQFEDFMSSTPAPTLVSIEAIRKSAQYFGFEELDPSDPDGILGVWLDKPEIASDPQKRQEVRDIVTAFYYQYVWFTWDCRDPLDWSWGLDQVSPPN
jgi:hypothetical protein